MLKLLEICFAVKVEHEAGYICAMLFIIPGFPFITSGIDLAKLDLRSGMERMMYSVIIISVATMTAWVLAMVLGLKPLSFTTMSLGLWQWIVLRICASFGGVFGFSVMFNSPWKLAVAAGIIGAVSNTLRLEMLDITSVPAPVAAFAGAVAAGVLASALKRMVGNRQQSGTFCSPCYICIRILCILLIKKYAIFYAEYIIAFRQYNICCKNQI